MAVFFLNLPRIVKNSTNGSLEYIYDAAGNKLAKKLNGVFVNFYCGSVVYTGSKAVKYVMHSQGMARPNGSVWDYQYNLTDHLGNVRSVASNSNAVLQRTDYFPFGLAHSTGNLDKNKYLYNGKEFQTELGFGMYDYHARMYDASFGIIHGIDPMVEKYFGTSPYVYVLNRPMNAIDPDGTSTWVISNGDGTYKIVGGDLEDDDYNIYIGNWNDNGEFEKGRILGETTSITSFYDDTKQDGKEVGWRGEIDITDQKGIYFLSDVIENLPTVVSYGKNAGNGKKYDFKETGGKNQNLGVKNHYRGMPIGTNEGKTVYTSARDVGNIAAGYVFGANGVGWLATRLGFDLYQSYKSGRLETEGKSSKNAQKLGFEWGVQNYKFKNSFKTIFNKN